MQIQIDAHTIVRAEERGASVAEIEEVINSGEEGTAKGNRRVKSKVFPFSKIRNGKNYEEKKVEVYFVEEANKIITVTVYVYYGKWR